MFLHFVELGGKPGLLAGSGIRVQRTLGGDLVDLLVQGPQHVLGLFHFSIMNKLVEFLDLCSQTADPRSVAHSARFVLFYSFLGRQ